MKIEKRLLELQAAILNELGTDADVDASSAAIACDGCGTVLTVLVPAPDPDRVAFVLGAATQSWGQIPDLCPACRLTSRAGNGGLV